MLTTSLLLAAASSSLELAPPAQASAPTTTSAFGYSFVQLGYARTDIDGFDDEADGLGVSVAYSVAPQVFVFAGLGFSTVGVYIIDLGTGDIVGEDDLESTTISAGVGFHHALAPRTDFVADVAIGRVEVDVDAIGYSDSTTVWGVEAGIRHLVDEKFEVNGFLVLTDGSDIDSELGVALGGRFYATPQFSVGVGLGLFEDSNSIGLNVRFQW